MSGAVCSSRDGKRRRKGGDEAETPAPEGLAPVSGESDGPPLPERQHGARGATQDNTEALSKDNHAAEDIPVPMPGHGSYQIPSSAVADKEAGGEDARV